MNIEAGFGAPSAKGTCLRPEDFYQYISGAGGKDRIPVLQNHLAQCPRCSQELAQLIEILHPESQIVAETALSKSELNATLALIQRPSRKEDNRFVSNRRRLLWPLAAAAAVAIAILAVWGSYYYQRSRADGFYTQARAALEQNYTAQSPNELRLALPFRSAASSRDLPSDSLRKAENLFFQALAVRDGMMEARLGLGYIYLQSAQLVLAREEFQKVLNSNRSNAQALLGRGVATYEQALASVDPLQRDNLLSGALKDFDTALNLKPALLEARYDRSWALFEMGRHEEALQEIERYLALDSGSLWAEKLRGLRIRIRATRSSAVDEEVNKAARSRSMEILQELAQQAPYQVPAAIRSAMKRSLEADPVTASGAPRPDDLVWAAQVMEQLYAQVANDHSWAPLLRFYAGLSPPRRALKKELDKKFSGLQALPSSNLPSILSGTRSLEIQYASLGDLWQIFNLHHFRGNSIYYGKADFEGALAEYREMHEIGKRLDSPDLIAKALGALAVVYNERRRFDDALHCARDLKQLAQTHKLDSWQAYACMALGNVLRQMGQARQSLPEFTTALHVAYELLDKDVIVGSLESLGSLMDGFGRLTEARQFYRLALEKHELFTQRLAQQQSDDASNRRLNLLFEQGDVALRAGDLITAERFFKQSLESARPGKRELESRNRIGLAQVYLRQGQAGEAEKMLNGVATISAGGQYPEIEWQVKLLKGELCKKKGDYAGAFEALQQSIAVLEQMRLNINFSDHRQSFLNARFEPYQEIVSLLYESPGDAGRALSYIDKAKSITLKEHLNLQGSSAQWAQSMSAGNSLTTLEYFFVQDKLLIFVTGPDGIGRASKTISVEEVNRQAGEFLESIRQNDLAKFNTLSRRLYGELIAPVDEILLHDGVPLIVILPDGPLHLLPFAALQDENGLFLIEKVSLAFAPSRTVLHHCMLRSREPFPEGHILLIDGTASLTSARRELEHLLGLYGRNAQVLGPRQAATYARYAADARIIHFAGHSVMRDGQPVLLLQSSPTEIALDSRTLESARIAHSQMVYLAGCGTAIGPIAEGETPWGLVPAFLNAGAASIIASLLTVDDASTQILTSRFYDLLKRGSTRSESLQRAQLTLLNAARSRGNLRPQSWAPYMVIGDPH